MERLYKYIEITDLKDMLKKSGKKYGKNIAYKIRKEEGKYKTYTHEEVRKMIDGLGTSLIDMGLKDKRIAVIGENRFEWEIAYLSIVCGTGIVVPLDKSLPENELESLLKRSEVEAIICSGKYIETLKKVRNKNLKYIISMDLEKTEDEIISQKELIEKGKKLVENGDTRFTNAEIDNKKMSIMLFTSGTTSQSKAVALSHKNICSNLMDIASTLDVNSKDIFLSFLPLHHVFECTVGFLYPLYIGAQIVFSDGIRHIPENLKEYKASVMASVPAIYERLFKIVRKQIEKKGNFVDYVLIDGNRKPSWKWSCQTVIGGDGISLSIAAASIIAKVTRDRLMCVLAEEYPMYGWDKNAGYGTKAHIEGLEKYGVTPYHRKTYAPIARLLSSTKE